MSGGDRRTLLTERRVLWRVLKPHRRELVGGLAATALFAVGLLLPPYLSKVLIDEGLLPGNTTVVYVVASAAVVLVAVLERHLRDALCSRIHTPQDDMVLMTAGKLALGVE